MALLFCAVKYPLLLEGLAKQCDPAQDQTEYEIIREVTIRDPVRPRF
jgi:hypothetical protein